MQKATVIEIGNKAIDHTEPLLLFFGEGVTQGLQEYAIIQKIEDPKKVKVAVGDKIAFGEEIYHVTYVGQFANRNLQEIEHVFFVFAEEPHEGKLGSSIYLTPAKLPNISKGMTITYQA